MAYATHSVRETLRYALASHANHVSAHEDATTLAFFRTFDTLEKLRNSRFSLRLLDWIMQMTSFRVECGHAVVHRHQQQCNSTHKGDLAFANASMVLQKQRALERECWPVEAAVAPQRRRRRPNKCGGFQRSVISTVLREYHARHGKLTNRLRKAAFREAHERARRIKAARGPEYDFHLARGRTATLARRHGGNGFGPRLRRTANRKRGSGLQPW